MSPSATEAGGSVYVELTADQAGTKNWGKDIIIDERPLNVMRTKRPRGHLPLKAGMVGKRSFAAASAKEIGGRQPDLSLSTQRGMLKKNNTLV